MGTDLMHVWDVPQNIRLETWRCARLPDRNDVVGDISPDGRSCLTIGLDGAAVLRDIAQGHEKDPHLDARNPFDVAYSADSRMFAVTSVGGHGYTKVWETGTLREVVTLDGGKNVGFSPDGKRLAIGRNVWDLESRRRLLDGRVLSGQLLSFHDVRFSPDGNVLGSRGVPHGELHLWRAPSWDELE
jgi:WD40 repeat protein